MVNVTVPADASTDQDTLTITDICIICVYFFILITGVIGNGLVIFVTGYKMKKTVNSVWFLNLAIADFIFILFLVLHIIVAFDKMVWPFGDFLCKCMSIGTVLNMFASTCLLTVISLDRCLCTWLIEYVQITRTLAKSRIVCAGAWLLSVCCSAPFFTNRSVQEYDGRAYCVYQLSKDAMTHLVIFRFLVGFLIPFLIIALSYAAIGVRVKRLKTGKRLKSFRVLSVILAFFICWFPFHVQQLCYMVSSGGDWDGWMRAAGPYVNCLAYVNSCLNPLLYVFMCNEYKKKLKTSLLLVLEAAFAEDSLGFRSSNSTRSRLLNSLRLKNTNDFMTTGTQS